MASHRTLGDDGIPFIGATRPRIVFGAFVAVLVAAGCTCSRSVDKAYDDSASAAGPVTGGSWIVGSIGDASSLLPLIAADSASNDIVGKVYCSLLRYGPNYEILGDLADRYEVLEDGLRIRFHLNPEARWHDGQPVTADDLLFTRAFALDPKTPTPYKSGFEVMKGIEKLDAHTVDYVYGKPFSPALDDLVGSAGTVLPKHLLTGVDPLTSPLNRAPVGCGPYKFKRWDAQREIELVANDDWFRGRAKIDHYLYRIIPDQATMFLELQNHGIDAMGLRPQQFAKQTDTPKFKQAFRKYRYTGFNYTYIGFNFNNPLFQDVNIRRALAHAVDKREIIDGVHYGLGQVSTGPYRPGMWYYKASTADPEYDLQKAKTMLAAAGWTDSDGDGVLDRDGQKFEFELITNQGNLQRKQVAEITQARFKALGIDVKIRIVEWSAFLAEFVHKRKFDAIILGWNTGIDPDQYDMWHSSKTGEQEFNFIGYRNPKVDDLLERGRRTFDQDERKAIYGELQDILAWEQPYIFLFIGDSLPAIQNRVQGVQLAEAGIGYNFEDWWIPKPQQGFHLRH